MGFWDAVKGAAAGSVFGPTGSMTGGAIGGASGEGANLIKGAKKLAGKRMRSSQYGEVDPTGRMSGAADQAGRMSGAGYAGYRAGSRQLRKTQDMLRRRAMGEDSLSAEQLRQGMMQNRAGMASMAASASPRNSAMAARTAMMQGARMGAGLSGQQALAGIQERQQAANALGQLQLGQRAQDVQMGLGAQGQQIGALQALEDARTRRYGIEMGVPTVGEQVLGGLVGLGGAYLKGGM